MSSKIGKSGRELIADGFSLSALALCLFIAARLMPNYEVEVVTGAVCFFASSAGALFVWHHPLAPKTGTGWLRLSIWSVLWAMIWFVFAKIVAELFFFESEPVGSRAFDLVVTLVISPGFTLVALIGWVREVALCKPGRRT